jgi:hypothetical protein
VKLAASVVATCVLLAGCAAPAAEPAAPRRMSSGTPVERFLPLQHGTVFSYETQRESSGEKGILVLRVNRPRANMAELIGARTERIDYLPDGIQYASGGYLLKPPLTEGATWKGRVGTVRVVSLERSIEVPAGHFKGCVETQEESVATGSKITTVFCPDVGIVLIDAQGQAEGDYDREVARLRYHGPAVDLQVGTPPP